MANNRFQVKRTSVAGRTPNTTNAGNLQYIAAGEFALNMTDQLLVTSDGTNLIYVGANQVNQRITNSLTLDNDKKLQFKTVNTSAFAYFVQQPDDNFVFYTTNASYGPRAIWSIFANNNTANLKFAVQTTFNGNVDLNIVAVYANGSPGTAGQILTTNGTSTYWAPIGAISVNTAAQYTWTNTQTFSANITFGNNIGFATATGIYFNGIADGNWRIGRNTATTTKFFYTGNTLDIIAANSVLEGIAFGYTGNTYLETGYAGTFTRLPVYVGNTTQNTTTTNTTITIQANTTVNSTHTASLVQVANSTSTANLTALDLKIGATTVVNATQVTATLHVGNVSGSYANITGQVNTATLYAATSANIASAVQANATGVWTTGTVNGAVHSIGTTFIANTLGVYHTGTMNAASHTVGTAFTANSTVVNAVSLVVSTNTATIGTGTYFVTSGQVLIGSSTAEPGIGGAGGGKLQVHGGGFDTISVFANSDTLAPSLRQHRKRVTGGTVQTGDVTGIQQFGGWSGTNYRLTGRIVAAIDSGTISDTSMPGYITLETTADGSVTPTERIRITQSGNVGIGNAAPAFKLRVDGTTSLAGAVSDITTLAAGNTTVTGFVNATSSVNAASHTVGTAFTANATVVNAVSYYSGTLLVANNTVINATHLAGYTLAAPSVLGSGTANGASLTYANVSGQVNTATLYATTSANIASAVQANSTGIWTTGTVNATTLSTGATFTANSTVVNSATYYSGTRLVANNTVTNATHLAGYTLAAPSVLGSGTANGASLTYANVSGQVNTGTLYVTTSANVASIVQANSLGVHVGANVVANTTALKVGNTTITTTNAVFGGTIAANGGIGTAKQVLISGAAANASWATLDMTYLPDAVFKKSVRAATTADLAAASATSTTITGTLVVLPAQDGITLVVGNRLLVKNQTAAAQNGIYEVTVVGVAATTAWVLTRTADADTSLEIAGAFVSVDEGTLNGGKVYDNDFKTTDTLGTTAMPWYKNIDEAGGTFLGNVVMGTGSTGIYPTSNTVGIELGNTTARWVLIANSGNFSTTLAAGNTTVTGFVNATSTVNALSHTVGTAFTANATVVNAVSYYSGTLLVANNTVINATHLAGYTLAAPSIIGSGTANGASLTYANVSGQVNTATLYAATSANIASIVQANSLGVHVGANVVANTTALRVGNTTLTTTNTILGGTVAANGGVGSAGQVLTSGGAGNAYWQSIILGDITGVTAGNGLTGGGTSGDVTVSVLANTGIVSNATGTYVNATYIGTISANNSTYFGGYTWAAPAILGGTTANGASLTYANVSGQVNTATLYATTSANVGANVQLTTSALTVGNSTANTTQTSILMRVANSTSTANLTPADLKIGATTVVNSTQVTATLHVGNVSGTYANITGQVNTATIYISTSSNVASIVQSNSLGVHVGANVVANTTALRVGNTTITTTNVVFGGTIAANGGIGSAGQVLTSGAAGNVYWSTVSSGSTNVNATYSWTNVHSFSNAVYLATTAASNVGIGTSSPAYKLQVNGSFAAVTKSFVIDHPTKTDMKLRYGSLEGPENGVYVRGKIEGVSIIELPEYWWNLVDENSVTVNLTPYGRSQDIWVKSISTHFIHLNQPAECFFTVFAERKDVDKLVVEF